jgi:elongation factor G
MEKDDPKPKIKSAGNKPPPRPPHRSAVGLGPEGDDSDKSRRTTVSEAADGEGKFIRDPDGSIGHYGHVIIRIVPNSRGKGIVISSEAPVGTIPDEYIKAVSDGIRLALDDRAMVDIIVRIVGGSSHKSASTELAFKMAGIFAIKDAIKKAGPIVID